VRQYTTKHKAFGAAQWTGELTPEVRELVSSSKSEEEQRS
jgi:hypothetical protein